MTPCREAAPAIGRQGPLEGAPERGTARPRPPRIFAVANSGLILCQLVHKGRCAMWRMSNTEAVIFMGWNAEVGTRLDRIRRHRGGADRRVGLEADP